MRILLVDDDVAIRLPIKSLLERLGHVVDTMDSAETAIEEMNLKHFNSAPDYDLVLTDHDMTGMGTGIDVIQKAKKISDKTDCWLMSGRLDEERIQSVFEAGASKAFQKPLTFDQLKEALSELGK